MFDFRILWVCFTIQPRIKKITSMPDEHFIGRGRKLLELARELGCSLHGFPVDITKEKLQEQEVVERIQQAARTIRDSWLWTVTVFAAVASAISAAAAWTAVLLRNRSGG